MKIIDCHTHLQSENLIKEYFMNRSGYAIVIKALDSLIGNENEFYKIAKDKRIFIIECIDVFNDITQQLVNINKNLNIYSNIVGIKIYLGYQHIYADNENLYNIYKFAQENNLSICFHCGLCASNLNNESNLKYSSCLPVGKIAKLFPSVNFIISHFDYPNFFDCAKIVLENNNVYTDISGAYENPDNLPTEELINDFVKKLLPVIKFYSKNMLSNKVMFGTDYFGIGSNFELVEEYIHTIKMLFGESNSDKLLFKNCLKAYPKIQKLI